MKLCIVCYKECKKRSGNNINLCSIECRFESSYEINNETKCFMWKKGLTPQGKPKFHIQRGKEPLATKFSYLLKNKFNDNLYQNKYIMINSCNEEKCVNPDHLTPKLRKIKDFTFSEEKRLEIFNKYMSDSTLTISKLAKRYNTTATIVHSIINTNRKKNNLPVRYPSTRKLIQSNITRTTERICLTCHQKITQENIKKTKQVSDGTYAHCYPCYLRKYREKYSKRPNSKCVVCHTPCITSGITVTCSIKCKFIHGYKIDKNNCWEWKSTDFSLEYKGTSISPRRFSYEHYKEKIQNNLIITTSCLNNRCVNPEHLKKTTRKEIVKKASSYKIRKVRQLKSEHFNIAEEVIEKLYNYEWNKSETAKHFNISRDIIYRIIQWYDEKNQSNNNNICSNCQKEHNNTESEFCSPECMQEFLLK